MTSPPTRASATTSPTSLGGVRLQKVLAAARRWQAGGHCEELIGAGRVEVDGQVRPALRRAAFDPESQIIRVDGKAHPGPPGPSCTWRSTSRAACSRRCRTTAVARRSSDFLGDRAERLFPRRAARLRHRGPDAAHQRRRARRNRLAHPSFEVAKDLLGRGARPSTRVTWAAACSPAWSSTTASRSPTSSVSLSRRAAAPWSRSRCTRAVSNNRPPDARRGRPPRSAGCLRTTVGPIKLGSPPARARTRGPDHEGDRRAVTPPSGSKAQPAVARGPPRAAVALRFQDL